MGLDNPIHIAFLLIVLLMVFGAKRLPEMGRSLGSGMRGFRDSLSGEAPHTTLAAAAPVHEPVVTAAAPVREPVVTTAVAEPAVEEPVAA